MMIEISGWLGRQQSIQESVYPGMGASERTEVIRFLQSPVRLLGIAELRSFIGFWTEARNKALVHPYQLLTCPYRLEMTFQSVCCKASRLRAAEHAVEEGGNPAASCLHL